MLEDKYIKEKTFEQFCNNQAKLIEILNHRMTNVEEHIISIKTDVVWIKKILWSIFGVAVVSLFTIIAKTMLGI